MKASKLILPVLMAGALLGGSMMVTDADARPHKGGCPAMEQVKNITDAQRAELYTLNEENCKKMEALRGALFVKREELLALHNAPTPDVKAVSEVATEISKLRAQMGEQKRAFAAGIDKILGLPAGTHSFSGRGDCGFGHGQKGGRGEGHGHGRGHAFEGR